MKQRLLQLAARIEALSLREQALVFAAAVALLAFGGYQMLLAPVYREQEALLAQILQQRTDAMNIDTEIMAMAKAYQHDPDAPGRTRLEAARQESASIGNALLAMQTGLVAPERMAPLVDAILRANGRLQLVSMRTLPVQAVSGPAEAGAPAGAPAAAAEAAKPAELLYRHGVEVTVRGNYLDMVDYLRALEAMPTRLFWGSAQLHTEQYPASRLTLTLYTLSLDRNWMKL